MSDTRRARATPETDGRRLRGQDNRARIIAAMLEMVREGEVAPSAEQVAVRADVGLRTVFRHFRDMDSLYREIATAIEQELAAIIAQPFKGRTWQERVLELIERRAGGFERIWPFERAASVARHRSAFLVAAHARMVSMSRAIVVAQLPPELAEDKPLVEALDVLLSVETWVRLRQEQGLAPRRAREVLEAAVRKLIS